MMENLRLDNTASALNNTNTDNPMPDFTALAASTDDGWDCSEYEGDWESCVQQNKINTSNTTLFTTNTTSAQDGAIYSYGNYYNWYTATAGHGTVGLPNGDVAGSICPSGWQLPSSGNGGQFDMLNIAVNSGATNTSEGLRAYPANFIYSGKAPGFGGGSVGIYYSSTANGGVLAYQFVITNGGVLPSSGGTTQNGGLPIRCLLINQ